MSDQDYMRSALTLARRGLGRTWPNPAVGCIIVNQARIVGRGWTRPGGRPHAETVALAQAGGAAQGAVAYVTLEPCAHYGKTPPCAKALIDAGIARVVGAVQDPDPRVAGRGYAMLQAAGIEVTQNIGRDEATQINQGFFKRVVQGLPYVTLKMATTLDGKIATGAGQSRWITGPDARRMVHVMRLAYDAVMVGSGTALADDPDLCARDLGAGHQPVRLVIDRLLSHRVTGRLGTSAREVPVWLVHGPDAPDDARAAWQVAGARLIEAPLHQGHIDLKAAMQLLAQNGLTRILCEGGAGLAAGLIKAGLVDDIAAFAAGALIGQEGRSALGPLALDDLARAPRLRLVDHQQVGGDVLGWWRFG